MEQLAEKIVKMITDKYPHHFITEIKVTKDSFSIKVSKA